MAETLKVGDKIPPFLVKDQEGYKVTDEDVRGTPIVIYFYSKNDSPKGIERACLFRENMEKFDLLFTLILGVSPDSSESHKKFIGANKLEFSLLSDEKKDMCRSFGVLDDEEKVIPTTFVIDSKGFIRWRDKTVDLKGRIDEIIKAVEEHCKDDTITFDDYKKDYAEFLKGSIGINEDGKKTDKRS